MNDKQHLRLQRQLRQIGLFLAAAILVPLLFTLITPSGWSTERVEQKSVTIGAQEVITDDLYLMADTITIDGIIKGDAVVAASQITVNGRVEGDLAAVGRVITINGTVNDDVHLAGQVLVLGEAARVNDDVIAAGYSLENKAGSAIGGSLDFLGGQGLLAGTVKQNARIAAGALQVAGTVAGNLKVAVGNHELSRPPFIPPSPAIPSIPSGLTLTKSAQVGGKLAYLSTAAAKIDPGAKVTGGAVRESMPIAAEQPANVADEILFQVQRLVALALVGWLLLRFVPGWTQSLGATVQARPLPTLGWGLVVVAVVITAAIALSILTVLLLAIAGLLLPSLVLPILGIGFLALFALLISFGVVTSFVPAIALSFWGGSGLMARLRPEQPVSNLIVLCIGLGVFVILTALPGVGDILNAIATFWGLGALWLSGRQGDRGDRSPEPSLVVAP